MKKFLLLFLLTISTFTFAHTHNMIMLGEAEIFLSHIVYKVPHNFQVILKVELMPEVKQNYLNAKNAAPENLMILLLDHMDISRIREATEITGTMFSENPEGERTQIMNGIRIPREYFQVIFLDELPLNLGK